MKLKLKVCGMRESENIRGIASLDPDYMGLIFFPGSPRNVTGAVPDLNPRIRKTGVFVNASQAFIQDTCRQYGLAAVQLHGEESPAFCRELKPGLAAGELDIELIKAFGIGNAFDFEQLGAYEGLVDYFLFDTAGRNRGGSGIRFNWELLKEYPSTTPFFLSGGIGPGELPAIRRLYEHFRKQGSTSFYGLDINSRFETTPGHKDLNQVKNFRGALLS